MKIPLSFVCVASLALPLPAQVRITTPVGAAALSAPAHADTPLPTPLARPPSYHGFLSALSGPALVVAGAPDWKGGEFTAEAHYVRFETGKAAGRYYTVKSGEGDRLVLDWNGETPVAAAGDEFNVIPYWTLATLLPASEAGRSFVVSPSAHEYGTLVYLRDANQPGLVAAAYFFRAGAWRKFGDRTGADYGGTPVAPDAILTMRNGEVGTVVLTTGGVNAVPATTVINAQGGSTRQDNELSLGVPASPTLAQSNLIGSGAFEPSASPDLRRDELRIYTGGGNVSRLVATYYYHNGAWRKVGAPVDENFAQTRIFTPGTRVVLNKAGTGGEPRSSYWTQPRLVPN